MSLVSSFFETQSTVYERREHHGATFICALIIIT